MILSISRRTDVPATQMDWFLNAMRAGFIEVPNPFNAKQMRHVPLTAPEVEGAVFWSKYPIGLWDHLSDFEAWPYYLQFTLTPYGCDLEPGLPDKATVVVPLFQKLGRTLGRNRLVWRYDPIVITAQYDFAFHRRQFAQLAQLLHPYTDQVVLSFLDMYRHTQANLKRHSLEIHLPSPEEQGEFLAYVAEVCRPLELRPTLCAEPIDGLAWGITPSACIDKQRLELICGHALELERDTCQRPLCHCVKSVDIGSYNTCPLGCLYCYANRS